MAASCPYEPGARNIGPREVGLRARAGWVGLATGVALLAGLMAFGAGRAWRLLVILPFALASIGFVQARAKT